MNNNVMSSEEFLSDLKAMNYEQRVFYMKAIELYFNETKLDVLDFAEMVEWMKVTDPDQIEAHPLNRQVRRSLKNMNNFVKALSH